MAEFTFEFDADQFETTFEIIPDNTKCLFEIVEADIVQTKDGSGQMLTYKARVHEPEQYAGRTVLGRLNIINRSPKAQEIGLGQLASLCKAMGINRPSDTDEMIGIPFEGTIGIEVGGVKDQETGERYQDKNKIKYYKPKEAAKAAPASERQQAPAPKPAAKAPNAPWPRQTAHA